MPVSVSTGVESAWPPKMTPGRRPWRRSAPTFLPSTVRGRTSSFGASAKWDRSPTRGSGDPSISGRGREVHYEADGTRQLHELRACQALEPDAPRHHAL